MQQQPVVSPDGVQMMPPPGTVVVPQGLPPGLAYLQSLDTINIHQVFDIVEVALGWEKNNKYRICNGQDQQFMYAKEDTDCMTRQCCGPSRPFLMNITDNQGQQLLSLDRPLRCQGSFMWCCYLQEMDIQSPPGISIGGIRQIWTCWTPKYEVYDAQHQPLFIIEGQCCWCAPCTDRVFSVTDAQKGQEVGTIIKHWGGAREMCGGVNDFSVNFPVDLDVMQKGLLLGATFLIDFNYFEQQRN